MRLTEFTFDHLGGFTIDAATRAEEYSPSRLVPDFRGVLNLYKERSIAVRRQVSRRMTIRYGPATDSLCDLYLPSISGCPIFVYLHGGYWQELDRHCSAFAARDFIDHGIAFAAVGYTLAPHATVPEIISQARSALQCIRRRAGELGVDPNRIVVSGSSAGAHLAAMTMVNESEDQTPGVDNPGGLRSTAIARCDPPAAAVLLSGIYDLTPLVGTYINDALGLTTELAAICSPRQRLHHPCPPLVIAVGATESSEFIRQHNEFADHMRNWAVVNDVIVAGRHHFDLPFDLALAESDLGAATLDLIESLPSGAAR